MRIGMVGLGRMGANMTRRLAAAGHQVVAWDLDPGPAGQLASELSEVEAAADLDGVVSGLSPRRLVWVMLPAGEPTSGAIETLAGALDEGDIIVNGGNCRWTDSLAYARTGQRSGVVVLDAGVSGGIWGLEHGYCLMVGGPEEACAHAEPVFAALAPKDGFARVGDSGAGHFAKMAHNGIEYALLQAYAEGFDLMEASDFGYDLEQIARLWGHGSVVRSWLLELVAEVLADREGDLSDIAPRVDDSGEGRWALEAGVEHAVPLPGMAAALFARFSSRRDSYGDRLVAALRQRFGGHAVDRAERR